MTLQERSQKLQARRQDVLSAQAGLRNKWEVSASHLTTAHIAKFTRALKARLLDTASGFGKTYLNLLVDEIRLDDNKLHIEGSYGALARAITLAKEGKLGEVPSFVPEWRPHGDSNPGYRRERARASTLLSMTCTQCGREMLGFSSHGLKILSQAPKARPPVPCQAPSAGP